MLTHPTHERLITLGLTGMAKALEEQRRSPDLDALSFEERVGLLVDREAAERDTKRLTTRLKFAALRQSACVEDVDLRTPRGIDRAVFAKLVGGDWIDRNENLLIIRGNRARFIMLTSLCLYRSSCFWSGLPDGGRRRRRADAAHLTSSRSRSPALITQGAPLQS